MKKVQNIAIILAKAIAYVFIVLSKLHRTAAYIISLLIQQVLNISSISDTHTHTLSGSFL